MTILQSRNKSFRELLIILLFLTPGLQTYGGAPHPVNLNDENERRRDSLAFELCKLYGADQMFRTAENQHIYNEVAAAYDSVIFEQLMVFIRENGYPDAELVGEHNYSFECVKAAPAAILLHSPQRAVRRENYPLLRTEALAGRMGNELLAYVLDKYYVVHEARSVYGSPFRQWTPAAGVRIEDRQESDSLRMDIGLPPLKDTEFIR